jgi:cytochrome d ubiquinol oxidase subunit I
MNLQCPIGDGIGHLVGDYTHDKQPTKFAAIEARWHDETPGAEVVIAWPNEKEERNDYAISIPYLGSLIGSMLPFALKRLGLDPATSSAPFVATFVDVTGLVIYFTVSLVVLRGTML